jgi:hypothetical protein
LGHAPSCVCPAWQGGNKQAIKMAKTKMRCPAFI